MKLLEFSNYASSAITLSSLSNSGCHNNIDWRLKSTVSESFLDENCSFDFLFTALLDRELEEIKPLRKHLAGTARHDLDGDSYRPNGGSDNNSEVIPLHDATGPNSDALSAEGGRAFSPYLRMRALSGEVFCFTGGGMPTARRMEIWGSALCAAPNASPEPVNINFNNTTKEGAVTKMVNPGKSGCTKL